MFDRWVRRGQISTKDLLQHFAVARSLQQVPALLGFEDHPDLVESKSPSSLRVSVAKIVYHCDIDSMFNPSGKHQYTNKKAKRKKTEADAKLTADAMPKQSLLSFDDVVRDTMHRHWLLTHAAK